MNYNKDEDVAFRFNIILLSTSKSTAANQIDKKKYVYKCKGV